MLTNTDQLRVDSVVAVVETNGKVSFAKVTRLTKTQVVLDNDRKFRLAYGTKELPSDNGNGHRTNLGAHLDDPTSKHVVDAFARQELRRFAHEASTTTYGSAATIHTLDAAAVCDELNRLADLINAARKEISRRARL
jgi:hypothetical protein